MTAQQAIRNSIIFVVVIAIALFLWSAREALLLLVVALILALALRGPVKALHQRGMPKFLAIVLVYIGLILVLALLLVVVIPPAVRQFSDYFRDEDTLITSIVNATEGAEAFLRQSLGFGVDLPDEQSLRRTVSSIADDLRSRVPALAGNFGGTLANALLVFVIAGYAVLSMDQAINSFMRLVAPEDRPRAQQIFQDIEAAVGGYVRGTLTVGTIVGVLNLILMTVFRVPNAGMLALICGTTTMVPQIGGWLGVTLVTLIAWLSSPRDAVFAFASAFGVTQLENYFLSPRIIESTVELNPVISITALLIGFSLAGVIGALIAVPIASVVKILLNRLVFIPREQEVNPTHDAAPA